MESARRPCVGYRQRQRPVVATMRPIRPPRPRETGAAGDEGGAGAPLRPPTPLSLDSAPRSDADQSDSDSSPFLSMRLNELQRGGDPTSDTSPHGTKLLERKMQAQAAQNATANPPGPSAISDAFWAEESNSSPQGAALMARKLQRQRERARPDGAQSSPLKTGGTRWPPPQ